MRCFGFAQYAFSKGCRISFVTNIHEDSFFEKLALKEGFNFYRIKTSHPHPDDFNSLMEIVTSDANQLVWVIADGYHLNEEYQKKLKDCDVRLMVIDDNAHLLKYHTNILLNPNAHAVTLPYQTLPHTVKLLGPKFLLFRKSFLTHFSSERNISPIANKILISMGGSDPVNLTSKVIEAIKLIQDDSIEVRVVVGPFCRNAETIERSAATCRQNVKILKNPPDFAEIIGWADIGVTTAGTSCWEMCLLGLPLITVTAAENQKQVGELLDRDRLSHHLGWYQDIDAKQIALSITDLLKSRPQRHTFSINQRNLVDGKGAERVLALIEILTLKKLPESVKRIRIANPEDCIPLWELTNDPLVRKNSITNHWIPYDEHLGWYQDKMTSDRTQIYILEIASVFAGQIRYDLRDNYADLSFSVAGPFRGMGLGYYLINNTWRKASRMLGAIGVHGIVQKNNLPSLQIFTKAGFSTIGNKVIKGVEYSVFERLCEG